MTIACPAVPPWGAVNAGWAAFEADGAIQSDPELTGAWVWAICVVWNCRNAWYCCTDMCTNRPCSVAWKAFGSARECWAPECSVLVSCRMTCLAGFAAAPPDDAFADCKCESAPGASKCCWDCRRPAVAADSPGGAAIALGSPIPIAASAIRSCAESGLAGRLAAPSGSWC